MPENLPTLTREQLDELGPHCAELLLTAGSWTRRRKEAATILDESMTRRRQSVDFIFDQAKVSLKTAKVCDEVFGPGICAAPLFILEKSPARPLAFDLRDETNRSLPLMTSGENGRLSGATLKAMCARKLAEEDRALTESLGGKLDALACGSAGEGQRWLRRLTDPLPDDDDRDELAILLDDSRDDGKMAWWLATFGSASIILVAFEKTESRRRVIKLSYDEPMNESPRFRTRLGWTSYRFWLNSPFIESERYHFEVKAPLGLRLTSAALVDDGGRKPVESDGFRRSAHLYISAARNSGGALAELGLRVSGWGVLGASLAAALLVLAAVGGCIHYSKNIAEDSSGAPALLLVLPGAIAAFAARPDQHGLITRLLAWPRWALLLGSAFSAYYAAGRIALSGHPKTATEVANEAQAIQNRLWPAFAVAAITVLVLFGGWIGTRQMSHRLLAHAMRALRRLGRTKFRRHAALRMQPTAAWAHVVGKTEPTLFPERQLKGATVETTEPSNLIVSRATWALKWVHGIKVKPGPEGTLLSWFFRLEAPWYLRPLVTAITYRERRMAMRRISALSAAGD